jgi:L-aspartate oxidase
MIVPPRPDPSLVRPIASQALGIVRDGGTLREAAVALLPLAAGREAASDPALVALMITVVALWREESRGAHYRSDFPSHDAQPRRPRLTLDATFEAAVAIADRAAPLARRA